MADSSYRAAGVDIDAATDALERIKHAVRATYTDAVLADIGGFGGMYALDALGADAVLVASLDGVGTKVKLAAELGQWQGIGYDIVNHCVNDILVQNARPLFFLDYVATSRLDPQQISQTVIGIAEACKQCGCVLLGGETAEMPGVYTEGAFDVVGAVVGVVARDEVLPKKAEMKAGDVVFALPSSGPHTNGYSLIRKIIAGRALDQRLADGSALGDALIAPHRVYIHEVETLQRAGIPLLGLAHITGGGLVDNVPRILPDHLCARIVAGAWEIPALFRLLVEWAGMPERESFRVFNMGIGMVVIVSEQAVGDVQSVLPLALPIGRLAEREENGARLLIG